MTSEHSLAGMDADPELSVRLGSWVERTDAEGPGSRTAYWVQGCSIRCPGCFNPHLWTERGGTLYSTAELADRVPSDVEGITLLGGEPFEQPGPMADLARRVQARGQTVMAFTGYLLEDLRAGGDPDVRALIDHTDLLVDGPFLRDEVDHSRPWVGSRNQRFHALTDRYADLIATLEAPDRLEIRVTTAGEVRVNGWASDDQLEALLSDLRRARPAGS